MEFFTDGAAILRSLTSHPSAESRHIPDWFHLTMRLTVLHQYARGLAQVDTAGGKALQRSRTAALLWTTPSATATADASPPALSSRR